MWNTWKLTKKNYKISSFFSVPLPRETRKLAVLFFFADLELRPRRLEISVSKDGGKAREIFSQAARLTNTKISDLKMVLEYKNRLNQIIDEKTDLGKIDSTDSIIISELSQNEADEEFITIGISHRKELKNGKILSFFYKIEYFSFYLQSF